jgi:hypothetical protein
MKGYKKIYKSIINGEGRIRKRDFHQENTNLGNQDIDQLKRAYSS